MEEQVKEPKKPFFELRDWRTSKFPIRLIIRGIFLTYMWSGMWQVSNHEEYLRMKKDEDKFDTKGFEYLTMCGFMGTSLSLFISSINEFFPRIKALKIGMNGLFLVIESLIFSLYWLLYFAAPEMIHDKDATEANNGPPPLFMDTSGHLIPFIAMLSDFMMTRSSKKHLYEHRVYHIISITVFIFGYFIWISYLFNDNLKFPYPFLREMSAPARIIFTFLSVFLGLFIYGVICRAYFKFHATENDLPVIEEEFYDDEEE